MITVRQIKVQLNKEDSLKEKIAKKIKVRTEEIISYKVIKKSLDARDKNNILNIYEVDVEVKNEGLVLRNSASSDILPGIDRKYVYTIKGEKELSSRPIIIGSGPAGLFCTYMLAKEGFKPILLEKGASVDERKIDVEKFWKENDLNTRSNIQFGEGGAGTFSDGKLNTTNKDVNNRMRFVFETFVENGASEDILTSFKPHIGSDILPGVVRNIRKKIIDLGGEVRFHADVTDFVINDGKINGVIINDNEEILSEVVVLALGNASRKTFYKLHERGVNLESKPFAVGVRIMHPQDLINISEYGKDHATNLGAANYKLTYQASSKRGVYSFCMCPGGYVVNASSEDGMLVINGMSNRNRDSSNANSAIIVTVNEKDYGTDVFDGIKFQEMLEKKAFEEGKGLIPVQTLKDFYDNKLTKNLGFTPEIKGLYNFGNINNILPDYICNDLKEAFKYFDTKIKNFYLEDAVLAGVETRTSCPIRIVRDDSFETNIKGLYAAGEGAGYAGGISSSAVDGLKTFEAIVNMYKKLKDTKIDE